MLSSQWTRRGRRFAIPALFLPAWALADPTPPSAVDGLDAATVLAPSRRLAPQPRGESAKGLPVFLRADRLTFRPDLDTLAEGDVHLRRAGVAIEADLISYDTEQDLATATGGVKLAQPAATFTGAQLRLRLRRFEGVLLQPTFRLLRQGTGGHADRLDLLDEHRAQLINASYTSCGRDEDTGAPGWELRSDSLSLDLEAGQGTADGAVLRFMDVPILALPRLSFPIGEARKSGWLPPTTDLDSRGGVVLSLPYYWNIATNRDATFTPSISGKRGAAGEVELRYLEAGQRGTASLHALPHDRLAARSRYALNISQEAELPLGTSMQLDSLRVSDDAYWKDFPRVVQSVTPRLLATDVRLRRPFGDWVAYARLQRWQILQDDASRIAAPYDRSPQMGLSGLHRAEHGFEIAFETELNRFTAPRHGRADPRAAPRPVGMRWHVLTNVARPFTSPGWTVTPRLSMNAATYWLDSAPSGQRRLSRAIPTLSIDSHWQFERETNWFGGAARQTLEPRFMYVNTPSRAQDARLAFDSAPKDFNLESLFSENTFSGVDRVADAHQATAGLTTRFLDPDTGAEALRLGAAQRYLLRDQRITSECAGSHDALVAPECKALSRRFSDVLLLGSTRLHRRWTLEGSVQYSPDSKRMARSALGARYAPGPYRSFGMNYRSTRGVSEQVELGWQWPIAGGPLPQAGAKRADSQGAACSGSWYSVGRIDYNVRESRVTDAVLGLEYDAGCWIGRVVATRTSTGRSEAATRVSFQLELTGLSKLNVGTDPIRILRRAVPSYRELKGAHLDRPDDE